MAEKKRYWMIVHYETEREAENEEDAYFGIIMGNTVVENATIVAREIPATVEDDCFQEIIQQARQDARHQSALSVILHQLAYKTEDYGIIWEGLSSRSPAVHAKLQALSLAQIEHLSIDALSFSTLDDLEQWLDRIG